ncbi:MULTISPECIES: L,D-transpeptidase [unclassified Aureimonas]|uniref:L,D-transpeptidase n=1 Tax=unclassified Aureimonas TaxID=2615206 RepID=UPI0009EA69D5|nr:MULTISPECIES: L,D-transpeptidase [unclassified Aureimonas]
MTLFSRRVTSFLALGAIALLSGCASTSNRATLAANTSVPPSIAARITAYASPSPSEDRTFGAAPITAYAAAEDEGFQLPAIPASKIDPKFLRQRVVYDAGDYEAGTVVVDTPHRFLYVVERGGTAMRYGIGVGKAGFSWAGEAKIGDKQHWPKWFPPMEMIDRRADLEKFRDGKGMEPGLMNPLGARALYLYQGNKDTLYRLHGTPEWQSIGTAASSGCIRLMNQDIIDLYDRVPVNARVVVIQGKERLVDPKVSQKSTTKRAKPS